MYHTTLSFHFNKNDFYDLINRESVVKIWLPSCGWKRKDSIKSAKQTLFISHNTFIRTLFIDVNIIPFKTGNFPKLVVVYWTFSLF